MSKNIHVMKCPVHQEETPSFMVDVDSGRYHCFGCGISGNLVDLTDLFFSAIIKEVSPELIKRHLMNVLNKMDKEE